MAEGAPATKTGLASRVSQAPGEPWRGFCQKRDMGRPTRGAQRDGEVEWDALAAEHDRLLAELARLQGQHPPDWDAHHAFHERLALHKRKLAAWRARFLRPG